MKTLKRILLGVTALLILLSIVLAVYLQGQKPMYSGTLKIDGLKEEVEVLYDDYGIPHIYAQHEEDAYLALGYVHAQDRLFQMEMIRRAAGGRLSEVLGTDLIKVDKLFRILGINTFAEENAKQFLSSDTASFQRAAHAYLKGINEYVRSGKTPIEFTIIGIPKSEFTAEDIYRAIGFMSFGFAEGLQVDPVLQKIQTEWGDGYLQDLAVTTPIDAERIKSFRGPIKMADTDSLIATIHAALKQLPVPLFQGSNGWAISGDRTVSGLPILANDTHIGFGQPAVWFEAYLEFPGFRFYGHHLALVPFGLLGNNHKTGWGLTMFENDDTDFFVESLNPENPAQVKFRDSWEMLTTRTEVIRVKGEEDVVLEVRSSRHGPIVNDILEHISKTNNPVSLSWQLNQHPNKALQAAYQLNHAVSLADAAQAASLFSAPGLNVMYADADGNIAWWAVAKLPIRPKHVQSKLFLNGSSGNDECQGYYDFSKNPQSINPPEGFVYSANNQPDSVEGILYPGYYYPKSRAGRIVELLKKDKKWTVEDAQTVGQDFVSKTHRDVAREIAKVLVTLNKSEYQALTDLLMEWNGDHQKNDVAPSVYYNLLSQIMFKAMLDELGAEAFHSLMETSVPKNSYLKFIQHDASPWWDNVHTKDVHETRSVIFDQAAAKVLALLHSTSGKNPADWTWGKIHTLTHGHALAAVKPLDKIFNVGPFSVGGGSEVINNLTFSLDTTGYFPVTVGPALRKFTDFAAIEQGVTISPTGQSGNVMSSYYSDQAEMFATGKFRKMLMNRSEIENQGKHRLVLKPHL
ncbi:MAG: penicillin acylase family protein [Cyclobacteriaceae bacterium]|nr:penicillin acylase family protein [Cyclobacteriaceae bacterium]